MNNARHIHVFFWFVLVFRAKFWRFLYRVLSILGMIQICLTFKKYFFDLKRTVRVIITRKRNWFSISDSHWKNGLSAKKGALAKSMNMNICVVCTSIKYLQELLIVKLNLKKINSGKTPYFVTAPFYTPKFICLKISLWQRSLIWKCWDFNRSFFN